MLNAEKYKKEILDTAQEGYYFAITKDRQNITRCCSSFKCENCIFYGEDISGCNCSRIKWLLSEYKEPIKLTRLEYEILKWLEKEGYKFIIRSPNNNLIAHDSTPKKVLNGWVSGSRYKYLSPFDELLCFVKWEDEEPTSIQDILKNCEVENE